MADAVTGGAVPDAEPPACAVQEHVVVSVTEVSLEQIVIDVLGRKLGADPQAGTQLLFGLTGYVEDKDKKDESPREDQR